QRIHGPFSALSFVMTEPIPGAVSLTDWPPVRTDLQLRRHLLRESGVLLRRLHEAGCSFTQESATARDCPFGVVIDRAQRPSLVLASVEGIAVKSGVTQRQALRDLATLGQMLAPLVQSRTDERRLFHYYLRRSGK